MIKYTLKCDKDHGFESWFQSAAAYDALAETGHLSCPICGSASVAKALMAPAITGGEVAPPLAPPGAPPFAPPGAPRSAPHAGSLVGPPQTPAEAALAALRRKVEEGSDYVGLGFATEARAIHEGRAPERSIWGEARADEARRLIEDGIPVAPLPFLPKSKAN